MSPQLNQLPAAYGTQNPHRDSTDCATHRSCASDIGESYIVGQQTVYQAARGRDSCAGHKAARGTRQHAEATYAGSNRFGDASHFVQIGGLGRGLGGGSGRSATARLASGGFFGLLADGADSANCSTGDEGDGFAANLTQRLANRPAACGARGATQDHASFGREAQCFERGTEEAQCAVATDGSKYRTDAATQSGTNDGSTQDTHIETADRGGEGSRTAGDGAGGITPRNGRAQRFFTDGNLLLWRRRSGIVVGFRRLVLGPNQLRGTEIGGLLDLHLYVCVLSLDVCVYNLFHGVCRSALGSCQHVTASPALPNWLGGGAGKGAETPFMDKLSPNLQLLVATAWVDNHLDPSEAILLRQILTATGIAKEEVESVLTAPPLVVGNLLDSIPNGHPREAVMRDVLRMVFSDGVLEAEEFDLLERIAQRLELDEETVDRLRQEVSDE